MIIINENLDSDLTLREISEKSLSQYEYSGMSNEYIYNSLKIALYQQSYICLENLSLYKFESLITFKKLMIERLENYTNEEISIAKLKSQIEKYSKYAILLIREIINTNQIKKMYN